MINKYIDNKKKIIRIHTNQKRPVISNWADDDVTESPDILKQHNGNFGWVLGHGDLIVDVDVKKTDGLDSFKRLQEDLNIELKTTVKTPSGGLHCYLQYKPEPDVKYRKMLKNYPGIDFLTKGCQVLIPPSSIDGKEYYCEHGVDSDFFINQAPIQLLNLIKYSEHTSPTDAASYINDIDLISIGGNVSEQQIKQALEAIPPDVEFETWRNVAMAINTWDRSDIGFNLFDEWSKQAANYNEKVTTLQVWDKLSNTKDNKITIATLFYIANDYTAQKQEQLVITLINLIDKLEAHSFETKLKSLIKEYYNIGIFENNLNQVRVTQTIINKYKQTLNFKISKKDVEKTFFKGLKTERYVDKLKKDDTAWYKKWCYVVNKKCYVSLTALENGEIVEYDRDGFNFINGINVVENENGAKRLASNFLTDNGLLKVVSNYEYLPETEELIVEKPNKAVINLYNSAYVPKPALEYTPLGLDAIKTIKRHLRVLLNTEENANIMLDWLAWCIQNKGKKVFWTPLIQSIEGVGKSFLVSLLKELLGDKNVGVIAPQSLHQQWNTWAVNKLISVFEEVKITGQSRYEAYNNLKPVITNFKIEVSEKNVTSYEVKNVTNYICLTNEKDSLPLDKADRRFWVVFCKLRTLNDITKVTDETSVNAYFDKLWQTLNYSDQILKFFLEHEVSKQFLTLKQAPLTDEKLSMQVANLASIELYDSVEHIINTAPDKFVNNTLVNIKELKYQIGNYLQQSSMSAQQPYIEEKTLMNIIKKMGYTPMATPYKQSGGKCIRLWHYNVMTHAEVTHFIKDFKPGENTVDDDKSEHCNDVQHSSTKVVNQQNTYFEKNVEKNKEYSKYDDLF